MKKVAVIGAIGIGPEYTTGQATKCSSLVSWLIDTYGHANVYTVNSHNWKKHPFKLLFQSIYAMATCQNIALLPAQHGVKVFLPLFHFLNLVFHRELHYIVVGGWLAGLLRKSKFLLRTAAHFDGIHVELRSMVEQLSQLGLNNCFHMPNCREYCTALPHAPTVFSEPLRVCTYSRVIKEKGILDAIEIVRIANEIANRPLFALDIYGKIENGFEAELFPALSDHSSIASYCGCKNTEETSSTLSCYFAMLFPTYYEGEGFAGTLLDAFSAGIPAIANDWKYNSEIIENGKNGILYPFRNVNVAATALVHLAKSKEFYNTIRVGCHDSANRYSTNNVMQYFQEMLK